MGQKAARGAPLLPLAHVRFPPGPYRCSPNNDNQSIRNLVRMAGTWRLCTPRFYRRMCGCHGTAKCLAQLPWHSEVSGTCAKSGLTQNVKPDKHETTKPLTKTKNRKAVTYHKALAPCRPYHKIPYVIRLQDIQIYGWHSGYLSTLGLSPYGADWAKHRPD